MFDLRGTINTLVSNDLSLLAGSPTPLCLADVLLHMPFFQGIPGSTRSIINCFNRYKPHRGGV